MYEKRRRLQLAYPPLQLNRRSTITIHTQTTAQVNTTAQRSNFEVRARGKETSNKEQLVAATTMLSLSLPIHLKPKPSCSSRTRAQQSQYPFSHTQTQPTLHSLRPHKSLTTTVPNVAVKEHNDGNAVAEEDPFPEELREKLMPNHVAVIMDGNGRWAQQRNLSASMGHQAGARSLRELVELSCKWGIRVLTVFAFSYDNWIRPQVEVDFLMSLFEREIKSQMQEFVREGIRISVIGDSSKLPKSLQKLISDAEETTKYNSRLQFIVAVSYSGKYDIVQACKSIASNVKDGTIQLEDISESMVEQELETNCTEYPYPDLLIRTSGELRVSNFLLWQLAYTELFFAQQLWPDFGKAEFLEALISYQQRQRRYGARLS